jgi:hypothetical protein
VLNFSGWYANSHQIMSTHGNFYLTWSFIGHSCWLLSDGVHANCLFRRKIVDYTWGRVSTLFFPELMKINERSKVEKTQNLRLKAWLLTFLLHCKLDTEPCVTIGNSIWNMGLDAPFIWTNHWCLYLDGPSAFLSRWTITSRLIRVDVFAVVFQQGLIYKQKHSPPHASI